jgi:DNA-binding transcriptional MocR family regulator
MVHTVRHSAPVHDRLHGHQSRDLPPRANHHANPPQPRRTVSLPDLLRLLSDWSTGAGPLYRKLADRLGELIAEGALGEGTLLPSERTLASALSVSRRTVEAAHDLLWAREFVQRRTGVGTWCTPGQAVPRQARPDPSAAPEDFIEHLLRDVGPLDLTVAGLPAHPLVAQAPQASQSYREEMRYDTHGYFATGFEPLLTEICAWFSSRGIPTDPQQVVVTTGAAQALWLAASLLAPGAEVHVENPTSPTILNALRAHRLRLLPVPTDAGGMMTETIAGAQSSAIFVTPSYLNPSGAHLSEARCRSLAGRARAGTMLVEDLALTDISLDGPAPRTIAALAPDAPVLSIGSLSKLYWAGLRLGWIRGPAPLIRRINRMKANLDIGTGVNIQAQATWLLQHGEEVRHDRVLQVRTQRDALLEALRTELPEWRWTVPDGGLSVWLERPSGEVGALCQRALRQGLRLLPGRAFDVRRQDDRHVRLPFVHPPAVGREIVRRLAVTART